MTEGLLPTDQTVYLPNGVVRGWAVHQARTTGTEGEEHKVVILSFDFAVGPGHTARQSFIVDHDTANDIRRALKNPETLEIPDNQENSQ